MSTCCWFGPFEIEARRERCWFALVSLCQVGCDLAGKQIASLSPRPFIRSTSPSVLLQSGFHLQVWLPDLAPWGDSRLGHGFQSSSSRLRPPDISRARIRSTRDVLLDIVEDLPSSGDQSFASTQPEAGNDTGGISMDSRNLPAVTSSTISLSRSIPRSADSSQPRPGKGFPYHRPNLM